jgi:hypothetical protein
MKTKTYSIMQVLNLAEELNKILNDSIYTSVCIQVEDDEELKALAIQERAIWHEPTIDIPFFWANVKLGNVSFNLEGPRKEVTVKFS